MNERQRKLLHTLLINDYQVFHVQDLSMKLDCSEKTVRNDLNKLEEYLKRFSNAQLVRKPGIGTMLEISEADKGVLFNQLFSNEPLTEEDRLIEIVYQLLMKNQPITLQALAEKYFVSKQTIKKDLDTIAKWLERYGLKLQTKERLGSYLEGKELHKRNALAHLSDLVPTIRKGKKYVLNLFLPYEVTMVRKTLQDLVKEFPIDFTDDAMESLLVHGLIMIKRTRQKSPVSIQKEEKAVDQYVEYHYATWFFHRLEQAFQVKFPADERIYYTWHFISAKRNSKVMDEWKNNETNDVVHSLMDKLGTLTLVDFHQDDVLRQGLAVHMHAVINRIKYGFPIMNPLLAEIKKLYPYLFSMVMLAVDELNNKYHLDIPEDEAAYLVLHFQASIERFESNKRTKKKAVIVCHMGIGMSNLLAAKMDQHFQNIDIVDAIGKADLPAFLRNHQVDFVVSTIPLEKLDLPFVVVSPLLETKDKKKLNHFIQKVEQTAVKEHASQLMNVLPRDLIFINVNREHRYEVIEMLGQALYQKGLVTEAFTHHAIKRERKSSTAIGGLIAIPHGSPSMIKKSAVALAILAEPLEWGTEKVSVVFMLALANEQGLARGVVKEIAALGEQPLIIQQLIEASEVGQITNILNR